jgi:hypothetical protein
MMRTCKRGTPAPSLAVAASKVFDLKLPVDEAAAGCQTMEFRQTIKILLRP